MESWLAPAVPTVPGVPQTLRLYDTSTKAVRELSTGDTARMYVCGITPYDTTHLGHAATYLVFDLIYRQILDSGRQMHYVQNVTDVDDPLFERAQRDGEDWRELGHREIDRFRQDMAFLSVLPPRDFVAATDTVDEVIELVEKLIDCGAAYRLDPKFDGYQDVYFSIEGTADFGYESGLSLEEMVPLFAERGGDPDRPGKRHPLDALLWRIQRPGEPAWPSPWGAGRPGWHIECSAIALNRLGMGFDIQGGGRDLVFPHHEFSAAHSEAANGMRFAQHYVHSAMIGLDGTKMSKSLGNLVRVRELREQGMDASALRLALFSGHYRQDRSWSQELREQAELRFTRWSEAASRGAGADSARVVAELRDRLSDDLDTPSALAAVDRWADATLAGDRSDPKAGSLLSSALDALLGVRL